MIRIQSDSENRSFVMRNKFNSIQSSASIFDDFHIEQPLLSTKLTQTRITNPIAYNLLLHGRRKSLSYHHSRLRALFAETFLNVCAFRQWQLLLFSIDLSECRVYFERRKCRATHIILTIYFRLTRLTSKMSFIKIIILAVCFMRSALALNLGSLSWLVKSDAFASTNAILVDSTNSEDILENILVASKLLESREKLPNDEKIERILRQFIALQPLAKQNGDFTCSFEEMSRMRDIDTSMKAFSKGNPYTKPRSKWRLNKMILDLQHDYGVICLGQFNNDFKNRSGSLDKRRVKMFSEFYELLIPSWINEERLSYGMSMLEHAAIGTHLTILSNLGYFARKKWSMAFGEIYHLFFPLANNMQVTHDELIKLFNDLIIGSCHHISNDAQMVEAFEKALELAKSIKLTDAMWLSEASIGDFVQVAAGHQVCKDLMKVDQSKVVEAIWKEIGK